jgi:negative regulator of flagellin synthesis FlgM
MEKKDKKAKETPYLTDNNIEREEGCFFMRINKINNVFKVYNENAGVKKVKDNNTKDKDQVKLSEQAIEFQHALKKVKELEEIRIDKVEDIKKQVQTGTYKIDGIKIAEKMIEDITFDKKI